MAPPPLPPTAAKPCLSSEQAVTGMLLVSVDVLLELSRKIARDPSPAPHTDHTDNDGDDAEDNDADVFLTMLVFL